jgi:hypothetical protein
LRYGLDWNRIYAKGNEEAISTKAFSVFETTPKPSFSALPFFSSILPALFLSIIAMTEHYAHLAKDYLKRSIELPDLIPHRNLNRHQNRH